MTVTGILASVLLSALFTLVFVKGLGAKGPWGSGWTFFIVIVLSLCTASLWVPPAGPVWFGAAWIDLLITGLLVSFVLSAVTPSPEVSRTTFKNDILSDEDFTHDELINMSPERPNKSVGQKTLFAAGGVFWMLLAVLCVLIILGAA